MVKALLKLPSAPQIERLSQENEFNSTPETPEACQELMHDVIKIKELENSCNQHQNHSQIYQAPIINQSAALTEPDALLSQSKYLAKSGIMHEPINNNEFIHQKSAISPLMTGKSNEFFIQQEDDSIQKIFESYLKKINKLERRLVQQDHIIQLISTPHKSILSTPKKSIKITPIKSPRFIESVIACNGLNSSPSLCRNSIDETIYTTSLEEKVIFCYCLGPCVKCKCTENNKKCGDLCHRKQINSKCQNI